MKHYLIWFLCTFFAFGWGRGEAPSSTSFSAGSLVREQLSEGYRDVVHLFTAPARLHSGDVLPMLGVAALGGAMVLYLDGPVDRAFARKQGQLAWLPAEGLANIGTFYDALGPRNVVLASIALSLSLGAWQKDRRWINTSRYLLEATFFTALFTYATKVASGRARPLTGEDERAFYFLSGPGGEAYHSFPSGHTSSAFALATVFAHQFPRLWVKFASYGLAFTVGLQRIEARQHWASDVVLGAILGHWVARQLVTRRQKRTALQVVPVGCRQGLGIQLNF